MSIVVKIQWDQWSVDHIARHNVTTKDVESVCFNEPMLYKTSYKDRIVMLGPTSTGRILAVVLGAVPESSPGTWYVFTARPAHRTERRLYDERKGGNADG